MMAKLVNKDNRDVSVFGYEFNFKKRHIILTSILSMFFGVWIIGVLLAGLKGLVVTFALSLIVGGIISMACYDCGSWDNFFGKEYKERNEYGDYV